MLVLCILLAVLSLSLIVFFAFVLSEAAELLVLRRARSRVDRQDPPGSWSSAASGEGIAGGNGGSPH